MTKLGKHQVAEVLAQIATLLEINGENPFKIRAYQNAAWIVDALSEDLETLIRNGGLTKIRGIGSHLAGHIAEIAATGRLKEYEKLRKSIPSGIFDILRIQGIGPKKARALWKKLSITNVGELEYACRENRLIELDGFGAKTQRKIFEGIAYIKRFQGFHLYSEAEDAAQELVFGLMQSKAVIQVEPAGSLRRKKELIRDIDLLASSADPDRVMEAFIKLPQVETIAAKGKTKSQVILKTGMNVDLRVVSEREFPFALQYFTGSKEHNISTRALAKGKSMKLNEYGLFAGAKRLACKSESEIFERLGLDYIPPELRENQGEIEAAAKGKLPKLVEKNDLIGVFHVHTNWSDGAATAEEMAIAAKKLGYRYIGIADHSQSAQYAGGLKPHQIKQQHREIDAANKKLKGITILKGIEADLLPDGSLDYPDSILATFDFVIASVHQRFAMSEDAMTKRIIKAIKNPYVSILGHPTGRLLLARDAYPVNMHRVIDAASEYGVAMEINAHPQRLDLDWRYGKYAKSKSVRIAIGADAHGPDGLADMAYGVFIARKGWMEKGDILNCLGPDEIKKVFKKAKNG